MLPLSEVRLIDRVVTVSYFDCLEDTTPKQEQLKIPEVMRVLTAAPKLAEGPLLRYAKDEVFDKYKNGRLFSLAKYPPGAVRGNGLEYLDGLVLDYDGPKVGKLAQGITPEQVEALFTWLENTDYLHVVYNSFTTGYNPPNEKLRVVLFFDAPVKREDYKKVWEAITHTIPVPVDPSSSMAARAYYMPRIPAAHQEFYDSSCGGSRLIETKKFLGGGLGLNKAAAPGTQKNWTKELETTSDKHHTLVAAAYGLGAKAAHAGQSLEQATETVWRDCRTALERNPEQVGSWEKAEHTCRTQVEKGWNRGQEELAENKVEIPEDFQPTAKQVDKAEKALKTQIKQVEIDFNRVQQAAYELGRYVPHVLSEERVHKALFKAATQLEDTRRPGMDGSNATLAIDAGLEKGKRSPHFIFTGWRSKLLIDRENGTIRACEENASLFLQCHPSCRDLLRHNVRQGKTYIQNLPPWETTRTEFPCELHDKDGIDAGRWLANQMGTPLSSTRVVSRVMGLVGQMNEYDPFKDWLDGLKWDAVPRLDSWLARACAVEDSAYHKLVGSWFIMSAVARTLEPGCDAQHALVLTGPQGIGKSQAFRALAGAEFFCANAGELGSEDFIFNLERFVIVELAELAGFRKKEIEDIKRLLTDTNESLREKYAVHNRSVLRRAVFGGTTNVQDFLQDETGNRRFWPVVCKEKIDIAWLEANRDQLWAEALHRVNAGGKWWPETEEEKKACASVQREHLETDGLDEFLDKLLEPVVMSAFMGCEPTSEQIDGETGKLKWVTMPQVYHILGLKVQDRKDQFRVKRLLQIRGWARERQFVDGKTTVVVRLSWLSN